MPAKPMCSLTFVALLCYSVWWPRGDAGSAKSSTAVYLDNGHQTVKQDLMTVEERNEVEEEILAMFGVPKKPMNAPKNLDGSAPQFLFDVYKSIQQDSTHGRKARSASDVGQFDDHTVQDSDVILTLYLSNHGKV